MSGVILSCFQSEIIIRWKQAQSSSATNTLIKEKNAKIHLRLCNLWWCILPSLLSLLFVSLYFLPLALVLSLMPTLCSLVYSSHGLIICHYYWLSPLLLSPWLPFFPPSYVFVYCMVPVRIYRMFELLCWMFLTLITSAVDEARGYQSIKYRMRAIFWGIFLLV